MTSCTNGVRSTALVVYNRGAHPLADPERMQNAFMAQSLKTQIADYKHFTGMLGRDVVVLVGGSSAGKSSIIAALQNLDKRMVEAGCDLTGSNAIYEFMEANHKSFGVTQSDWEHFHTVLVPRKNNWHIHEAVAKGGGEDPANYGFKSGASAQDQKRALETAGKLQAPVDTYARYVGNCADDFVLNSVLEQAMSGNNVTFDMCDFDKIAKHPLSQFTHVKSVFVYCPFGKLTERVAERNRKALTGEFDASEIRAGAFPLMQYAELVRPKQEGDSDEEVVDTVTLEVVERDFEAAFDAGVEVLRQTPEGRIELSKIGARELAANKAREKEDLLAAFGFTKSDPRDKPLQLVPRRRYDLCIDTSSPQLGSTVAERVNTAAKRILQLRVVRS